VEACSAPPDPLAGFGGPTSKGRGKREGKRGEKREREERRGKGKEGGKGKRRTTAIPNFF